MVRYSGDGTERLRRLSVGLDLSSWICVDAGEVLVVALARLKRAVLGVVWRIVCTSNTVVDVLAEVTGVGASRIAGLEAKEVSAIEARIR